MASQAPQGPRENRGPERMTSSFGSRDNIELDSSAFEVIPDGPRSFSSIKSGPSKSDRTDDTEQEATRTCWICQMDDTEDTPEDSEWRSPCPCSLTAHDSCLQEWISSQEAPKPGEIAHNHHIKCPQCKAEINIERPQDYLVMVVEQIQRLGKLFILPTAISAIAGCTYSGFMVYGWNTLGVVFGREQALTMLVSDRPAFTFSGEIWSPLKRVFSALNPSLDPFFPHQMYYGPGLYLGVPLIAPALVLSRTKLADQVFALLLPLYFLNPLHRNITWPPSPGLAFAALPYLRTAYNEAYRRSFGDLEKSWDLAVQRRPRPGETAEQIAAEAVRGGDDDDDAFGIELDIAVADIDPEDLQQAEEIAQEEDQNLQQQDRVDDANVLRPETPEEGVMIADPDEPPPLIALPGDNENVPDPAQVPGAAANDNADWNRRWEQSISLSAIASTVMGALFFPTISSLSGELLNIALPHKLTQPSVVRYEGIFSSRMIMSRGLLKEKWGRTLVGGCLFVVLKDVVTLYCKWRKARDFGRRKVKDWVGKRHGESLV